MEPRAIEFVRCRRRPSTCGDCAAVEEGLNDAGQAIERNYNQAEQQVEQTAAEAEENINQAAEAAQAEIAATANEIEQKSNWGWLGLLGLLGLFGLAGKKKKDVVVEHHELESHDPTTMPSR